MDPLQIHFHDFHQTNVQDLVHLKATRGAPRPTRGAQVGGPTWGPSGWAHAGPKWVGPSWAQVGPSQKFGTPKKSKNQKFSKSKSVLPKMSARSGLAGKKTFPAPFGALAAIHPRWGNRSTARVSSRKYFIPGCVGRGLDLDLRIRPAAAASGNPGFGPLGT